MLTLQGYRVAKQDIQKELNILRGVLSVKPYIPSVFVKPQYVQRFEVYRECDKFLYVPKHFGIERFGPIKETQRDVPQTPDQYWEFAGQIRDAQKPVVNAFLHPQPHDGILSLQTGGGKTVCAIYIASQLKLPTLVLVHSGFLKDQWIERIKTFLPNARIGMIQGETFDIENKDIVVGMLQTIALKDHPPNHFKSFGLVIVDECQHIASECFSQAIPKLTSTYMLGLSATPERKDRLMHVITWFLGPILYRSNSNDKVDAGVKVEYIEFNPDDAGFNEIIYNNSGVMFTSLMINKLVKFDERNRMLVDILIDLYEEKDRQILVLSDRVEHTKILLNMLPDHIQQETGILSRTTKAGQREDFCRDKRILISTYHLCGEGFDVPTLNTLVMATPRPTIEQIVGRILRNDKSKRTVTPLIIDIVDSTFKRQFQQRLNLYKDREYTVQKIVIQ
jgi:superfamily II DNA or RNA helicase